MSVNHPLMLFGMTDLTNWSFEEDAPLTDPPTTWDAASSVNGINEVVDDEYDSPGPGLASAQSLRQNVDNNTPNNTAVVIQRFQNLELFDILRRHNVEYACTSMLKVADSKASDNTSIIMKQFSGGSATIGSGTEETAPLTRTLATGDLSAPWNLQIAAETLHASTEWIEIHLQYKILLAGDYGATSHAYWDRVLVGGFIDFPKNFRSFDGNPDSGIVNNVGNSVVELVRVKDPRLSSIDMELTNVLEGSSLDSAIQAFYENQQLNNPGFVALWGDRNRFENFSRHFQRLYVDPRSPRWDYPPGVTRKNYDFKFAAEREM